MKKSEMQVFAALVADEVYKKLAGAEVINDNEMVNAKEAAKIVGYSVDYLRHNRHLFPHVKGGTEKQGRLMFRKKDLIEFLETGKTQAL